jgi:hypothetical protein
VTQNLPPLRELALRWRVTPQSRGLCLTESIFPTTAITRPRPVDYRRSSARRSNPQTRVPVVRNRCVLDQDPEPTTRQRRRDRQQRSTDCGQLPSSAA